MVTKMMVITASTTFNLPSDWNPINNTFWAWGAGGDGGDQPAFGLSAGGGGGGAGFAQALGIGGASGDLLTVRVGQGGGGKTNNSTRVTHSSLGTIVEAQSGQNAGGTAGLGAPGGGGNATTVAGSNSGGFGNWGGGGGGSAAGPHTSNGTKGGNSTNTSLKGAAGGGGAVGDFNDPDESLATNGADSSSTAATDGASGYYGTGGGAHGVNAVGENGASNTGGGGGGGSLGTPSNGDSGFAGGNGASWDYILTLTANEWIDAPFTWTTTASGRWAELSNGTVPGGAGGGGGGGVSVNGGSGGTGGAGGFPGGGGGGGGFGTNPNEGQGGAGAGGLLLIFYEGEDGPGPEPSSSGGSPYYIERMDNRIWPTIDDAWCLDSALELPQPEPDAVLTISSAEGDGSIRGYTIINGGSGYTAPQGQIYDPHGTGSGASVILTASSGVIITATPTGVGSGYISPVQLSILDTTGAGAVIQPIVSNYTNLTTNTGTFTSSDVGSIIRGGGGKIEIVAYNSSTSVTGNVISPVTRTLANDSNNAPVPLQSGQWNMTEPTMTVSGLWHLEGLTVAALADGGVVQDLVVENGSVTLPVSASQIVVGLPFTAQLQTMYLDAGAGPTVQGRRKSNPQVIIRVEASRPMEVGANQPDQAAQPNQATVDWTQMTEVKFRTPSIPAGLPMPLYSGDYEPTNLFGQYDTRGQVAIQQTKPVPLTVLAVVIQTTIGDTPGQ